MEHLRPKRRRFDKSSRASRILAAALTAALATAGVTIGGVPASAANNVAYVDASGTALSAASAGDLVGGGATSIGAADTSTWWVSACGGGARIVYTDTITLAGDVNVILADGCTLSVTGAGGKPGVAVGTTASLTVWGQAGGTGMLEATGSAGTTQFGGGAGIGGAGGTVSGTPQFVGSPSGAVTVNGGVVTATGGSGTGGAGGGAGIGGGAGGGTALIGFDVDGGVGGTSGAVMINGGAITATGGDTAVAGGAGAGIGGGGGAGYSSGSGVHNGGAGGASGTVSITGGTVTAAGGDTTGNPNRTFGGGAGAGIGGGGGGQAFVDAVAAIAGGAGGTSGAVTATGAPTVQAYGGGSTARGGGAAGIGGGGGGSSAGLDARFSTGGTGGASGGVTDADLVSTRGGSVPFSSVPLAGGGAGIGSGGTGSANGGPTSAGVADDTSHNPGGPSITAVFKGDRSATVNFDAPTSDGGVAITRYRVTVYPTGAYFYGTGSPIAITGLTNATLYSFSVAATNDTNGLIAGWGPESARSLSVLPVSSPVASTTLTLTADPPASGLIAPRDVTLTATISGAVANGGAKSVQIEANGQRWTVPATLQGSDYVATHTISGVTAGSSNTFVARYFGDTANNAALPVSLGYAVPKADQAPLSITDPGALVFGGNGFTLSTSGGSGTGSVTFSAPSGVLAVAADGTTTIVGAGTVTITAVKAGDAALNPATATLVLTVAKASPSALSISGVPSAPIYGDDPFTLSTSGGSGTGAVSYQSSDPSVVSVAGAVATINRAGSFTITAVKAGDATYEQGAASTPPIEVIAATPAVTLTATGGATIDDPIVLTATVPARGTGATPSGSVVFREGGATIGTVVLDGTGRATFTIDRPTGGEHTYTAGFAGQSGRYAAASADLTRGVGKADQASLTIADPGTVTYGDPAVTPSVSGGSTGGAATYSLPVGNGVLRLDANGTLSVIGAGTVTLTAERAGDASYNAVQTTRSITVQPRAITVTADDQSTPFGADDPALTWTTAPGLLPGDALTGSLTYTGIGIGAYDIVQGEPLANPNYAITFVKGTFTITRSAGMLEFIDAVSSLPNPVSTWADADLVAAATNTLDALTSDERGQLPSASLEALATAQEQAGPVNHADAANGVRATSSEMPWNVRVRGTPVAASDPRFSTVESGLTDADLLALFDISFADTLEGSSWRPDAPVTVELSGIDTTGRNGIAVVHQKSDGSLETIAGVVDGTAVTFVGTSFSLYGVTAVVEDETEPGGEGPGGENPGEGPGEGEPGGTPGGPGPVTSPTPTSTATPAATPAPAIQKALPATGAPDATAAIAIGMLALALGAGLLIFNLWRRRTPKGQ